MVHDELLRRRKTEEAILRIAFDAGANEVMVSWPDRYPINKNVYLLPWKWWPRHKMKAKMRQSGVGRMRRDTEDFSISIKDFSRE